MSNAIEYKDIMAFHPGYYVADIIEDMGVSQAEFAIRLGTTPKTLSQLVNGQINISNNLAKKLSIMMGTSAEVWLNLQSSYDEKLIEIEKARDFDAQVGIASLIDYSYFESVCGFEKTKDIVDRINNLCKYFMVSDLRIMLQPDFLVNFKMGIKTIEAKNMINSRAWVQTAINFSKSIETKPYNADKLKGFLPELRSMTVMDPEFFLPRMRAIFSECGVAFVLLPNLKNSGINGAVKWMSNDRVVLAMNSSGLDVDKFWFSLFHEIKHVLQQKIKTVFISSTVNDMMEMNKSLEDEADLFASDYLIPKVAMKKFNPDKYTTDEEVEAFADSIGIHPGIVAGRLQHDKIIAKNHCAEFKEKYVIEITKEE